MVQIIDQQYDAKMRHPLTQAYYDHSNFYNFGYWEPDTATQQQACENLLDRLLGMIPHKAGKILDVACGLGATTGYVSRYYPASAVTGINISFGQLQECTLNSPDCNFVTMDAANLGFADKTFHSAICVEAAFHFDRRIDFLREMERVLVPGGYLVLSDMLFPHWSVTLNPRVPNANWVPDLAAYREVYRQAGFQDVTVLDVTEQSWTAFYRKALQWRTQKVLAGEISPSLYASMVLRNFVANLGVSHYVLVCARKTECK